MITRTVGARLLAPSDMHTLSVSLTYDPDRPLEVVLAIETETHWVEWPIARDLLADGITDPTGDGDVRVEPDESGRGVWITLASPTGHARFLVARGDVIDFVDLTIEQVRLGEEHVDLDALEWEVRL